MASRGFCPSSRRNKPLDCAVADRLEQCGATIGPSSQHGAVDQRYERCSFDLNRSNELDALPFRFGVSISKAAWRTKPSWAVVATADRAINPDLERFMTQRAESKTIELHSSHVAYISRPAGVAKLIEQAATQSGKSQ